MKLADAARINRREFIDEYQGFELDPTWADRMAANLEAGRGQASSQAVLLAMVRSGRPRDEAYRLVQVAALEAAETGRHLREALQADPALGLDEATLNQCFSPRAHLARAEVVFERLAKVSL